MQPNERPSRLLFFLGSCILLTLCVIGYQVIEGQQPYKWSPRTKHSTLDQQNFINRKRIRVNDPDALQPETEKPQEQHDTQKTTPPQESEDSSDEEKGSRPLQNATVTVPPETATGEPEPESAYETTVLRDQIVGKEIDDDAMEWGHYKPHMIYSLSQRDVATHNTVAFNTGYLNQRSGSVMLSFRQKLERDEIRFEFVENDGHSYSAFQIEDQTAEFSLQSSFLKVRADSFQQDWIAVHRHAARPQAQERTFGLVQSFGVEVYDEQHDKHLSVELELRRFFFVGTVVDREGNAHGYFTVYARRNGEVVDFEEAEERASFFCEQHSAQSNWRVLEQVQAAFRQGRFANAQQPHCNFGAIMFTFSQHDDVEFVLQFSSREPPLYVADYAPLLAERSAAYAQRLNRFYEKQSAPQPGADYRKCLNHAISNLFGGLTYKYGSLQIRQQSQPVNKPIFSFTPSRQRFSWSFLWDDGFHNAVACRVQPQVSFLGERERERRRRAAPSETSARNQGGRRKRGPYCRSPHRDAVLMSNIILYSTRSA